MILVHNYKKLLYDLLKRYKIPNNSLEIVSSVQEWCRKHGIEEDNPFRIAKCFLRSSDDACLILIAEQISDDDINSVKSAMERRGFSKEVAKINTDEAFLIHTVLHEIAFTILEKEEQEIRDSWAFKEFEKISSNNNFSA